MARAARLRGPFAYGRGRAPVAQWATALVVGADDLEVGVDEDVVGPVDADVVDLVIAVAELHDTVDGAAGVDGQRGFGGLVRGRAAGEGSRPLAVVGRDRADLLGRPLRPLGIADRLPPGRRCVGAGRVHDDLAGGDGRAVGCPQYQNRCAAGDGGDRGRAGPLLVGRGGRFLDGHLLAG